MNEKEKEEQEIQFLLKILQGIIDYDLDGKGREKKENGNENKNDNGNEVLLETLIHMLEEELDESQENVIKFFIQIQIFIIKKYHFFRSKIQNWKI